MWENEEVVDDGEAGQASSENTTGIVRLADCIGPADLAVEASDCGQYVMLMCGSNLVAVIGAMGSDVEVVEFADGRSFRVEELMDLVAA